MCRKGFKAAISKDDPRLKEPHIAVLVYWREDGPKINIIGRGKDVRDSQGNVIRTDFWYDLAGGKAEPIYDPEMLKAGVPVEKCKIIDVETGAIAATNEVQQEINAFPIIGDRIDSGEHPGKPGLNRHFYRALAESKQVLRMWNKVPDEHYFVFETDPENAITLLDDRITDPVRQYIRDEEKRLWEEHTKPQAQQIAYINA